ncbi:MAG: HAMP domain-containing histidine kinase [Flavobacteriales bacterium]|nr:HAMP domain-containing histidine kinase [Flavobacteriales bacterium]
MNSKRNISSLILLASLVLVSLIAVQIYWVNNAIKLKQEAFDRNAKDAVNTVIDKLEKKETLDKLRSHQKARFLFFNEDSITQLPDQIPDSGLEYLIVQNVSQENGKHSIKMIKEITGERKDVIEKEYYNSDSSLFREVDVMDEFKIDVTKDTSTLLVKGEQMSLDSLIKSRIGRKTTFVGDIVKRLMEVNLYAGIGERINKVFLDSLLQFELQKRGISTKYEYGVLNEENKIVLTSDQKAEKKLLTSEFEAILYPNDIVQSNNLLKVHFPNSTSYVLKSSWIILMVSLFIIVAISALLIYTLRTIYRQKRLSEIKNDFINNMTHELKTPISTISLAHEALQDPDLSNNATVVKRYVDMIGEENKRLGTLVQNVLQHAVLDKGGFALKREIVNFHDLINNLVDKINLQVREKEGTIVLKLDAKQPNVQVDEVHFTNVVYNLLDNANKYSPSKPEITVRTWNEDRNLMVSVSDKGQGIAKENVKHVFDKLYRVPTGNLHDVKGFGLGLSYVKIIVEKHLGTVDVKSQLNKGSEFIVKIPMNYEN